MSRHSGSPSGAASGVSANASAEPGLARAAGVTGAATLTSRILGVVREQVLASAFGASDAMDAFNVAFRVPNMVRDLFAEGAMSAAFVPTFTKTLTTEGRAAAWRLASIVINTLLVATGLLVVAGIVFARPLVGAFAGDYAQVPGKLELTVGLTRAMTPFLMLIAVAAACMGMLNSLRRFFMPALSPATFNVATVVCALALTPLMPALGLPPIASIAIGTLAGGIGQIALQWPGLRAEGYRHRFILDFSDPGLRRILLLMGPGTIGLAATQVNVFVNTLLATGHGTGAVSWLNYAFRLMYLPIGLFGVSVATATVPAVSRHAAGGDDASVRTTVADGLSLMLMLNVPATVGLVTLATPIVQLLFERNAFTPADTAATAGALQFYAVGLVGYSVSRIVAPTFYALGDSRTPVMVSVASVLTNATLNIVLSRWLGFTGLALGTSFAALVSASLLVWRLSRRLDGVEAARVTSSLIRIALASALMGLAAAAAYGALDGWMPGASLLRQGTRLALTIGVALVVLAASAWALRIPEFRQASAMVLRRLGRTRA
ncbi:MAG: murein biosynthesis integral membrane protein MurJ [Vicinamibacterales bacterium]